MKARIEKYVDKNSTSCWLWQGSKNAKGYGICADGLVHRAVFALLVGDIPDGKYVLHHCDVRHCCNPAHLYVGTQKDNVRDMWARGRSNHRGQPPGEKHTQAKISEQQALEIIKRVKSGGNPKEMADEYKINANQIRRIASGQRWAHLHKDDAEL